MNNNKNLSLARQYTKISFILFYCAILCSTIFFRQAIEHLRYIFILFLSISLFIEKQIILSCLKNKNFQYLFIFLIFSLISLILNYHDLSAIDEIVNWILIFFVGYVTSYHLQRKRNALFSILPITIFTVFIVVPLLVGDGLHHLDLSNRYRIQMFFDEKPNHLGLICSISMCTSFYFALKRSNLLDRAIFIISGIIALIVLIKTGARTAFLGSVLVCGGLFLFHYRRSTTTILVTLAIALCSLFFLNEYGLLKNNRIAKLGQGFKQDRSFQQRKLTWTIAADTIRAKPLFGEGFDTFRQQYKEGRKKYSSQPDFKEKFPFTIGNTNNAHNFSLHFLSETGIFGFFAITLFWISIIYNGIKAGQDATIVVSCSFILSYFAFQLNMSLYGSQLSTILFSYAGLSSYVMDERTSRDKFSPFHNG
jgi:O-antigen ligase